MGCTVRYGKVRVRVEVMVRVRVKCEGFQRVKG